MVQLSLFALTFIAATASGAPLSKRIAQTISASTAKWEQACRAAGGAEKCNPLSIKAFSTLLAAAGPCEQQNAADEMIDLAKSLNNDAQMISLSQIFAQQPRNTPTSQSVPYCQEAPKNPELNGLFECQFAGANPDTFVGGVSVGAPGTVPFGLDAPVNPPGSCPAHPDGPIPDGAQLVDITQNPGEGNDSSQTGGASNTGTGSSTGENTNSSENSTSEDSIPTTTSVASAPSPSTASTGGDFKLQNGKDAQELNAKFADLNENSPCTDGDQACVNNGFAQCVNGKFAISPCSGSLICAALPLVNKAGTSIACTTKDDAAARIAATGATGGITGSDASSTSTSESSSSSTGATGDTTGSHASSSSTSESSSSSTVLSTSTPSSSVGNMLASTESSGSSGDFKLQNGQDAQKQNAQFATLTADSPCNDGDQACIGSGFAQCVNGKFVVTPCTGSLICAALPLVNSPGTSIACTTEADALARIQATGASGGIDGA